MAKNNTIQQSGIYVLVDKSYGFQRKKTMIMFYLPGEGLEWMGAIYLKRLCNLTYPHHPKCCYNSGVELPAKYHHPWIMNLPIPHFESCVQSIAATCMVPLHVWQTISSQKCALLFIGLLTEATGITFSGCGSVHETLILTLSIPLFIKQLLKYTRQQETINKKQVHPVCFFVSYYLSFWVKRIYEESAQHFWKSRG